MDPTLEFLWSRTGGPKGGPRRRREFPIASYTWANGLLDSGIVSEAIVRLSSIAELALETEATLIARALRDMGRESLEDQLTLLRAVEQASVADYLAGKIDGWTLIFRGCDLYYALGDREIEFKYELMEWTGLADEADLYDQGMGTAWFSSLALRRSVACRAA